MAVSDYSDLFNSAGQANGIDPDLLRAVATVESSGDPNAVSPKGAVGLMQLMPSTAKALGVTDATDPKQAIPAAARLLAQNGRQFGGADDAILAYHGGTDQANWGPKTQAYHAKIAQTYQQLKSGNSVSQTGQSTPANDAFSVAFAPSVAAAAPVPQGPDAFDAAFSAPANSNTPGGIADLILGKSQPTTPLQAASSGVVQGARNVVSSLDPVAQWLDKHVGSVTLRRLLPTADQAHANNLAARTQFNQQYGNNGYAQGGQVLGEVAASLPALAAGGEVLAPIAAAADATPLVGPAARFVTGATKGNKLLELASKGTFGAGQGAAAAATTSGGSDQPVIDQMKQGATLGGVLGAAIPAVTGAGGAVYNKLTGGGVNPATAALADKAINQYGIPLRGSQISSSPFINYLDSAVGKMPFSGLEGQNEAQKTAFSRAVAGTFGESADNLTPQVMSNARSRIGGVFNRVAANTTIGPQATSDMANQFANIETDAQQVMGPNEYSPIKNQMDNILSRVSLTGEIDGATYQAITRKGAPLDSALSSSNPNIRQYAGQIRSALDDALQASAAPQDLADLSQARLQWKNMRTVQDIAAKAGIEGEISPPLLLNAVKKSYKDMAYSGAGQIGDLADIGQNFLKQPPSSGTGERAALYSMLGFGGETAAEALHNPDVLLHRGAMLGGLLAAGKVIGSGLKSNLYRNALLRSVTQGQGSFAPSFGIRSGLQTLGTQAGHYAVPLGVIAAQQNRLSAPPVASPP